MAWSRASSRSRSIMSTKKVVMMPKIATTTATPSRAYVRAKVSSKIFRMPS